MILVDLQKVLRHINSHCTFTKNAMYWLREVSHLMISIKPLKHGKDFRHSVTRVYKLSSQIILRMLKQKLFFSLKK